MQHVMWWAESTDIQLQLYILQITAICLSTILQLLVRFSYFHEINIVAIFFSNNSKQDTELGMSQ